MRKILSDQKLVSDCLAHLYEADESQVKIPVKHPGVLEVPEGKNVTDMSFEHFKALAKKKGYGEIAKALTNLIVWNKTKKPSLSQWADSMQNKLQKWHESEGE